MLELVARCAGQPSAPAEDDLDELAIRIRTVAAFVLSPSGRYPKAATRFARRRIHMAALAGAGPMLELFLDTLTAMLGDPARPRARKPGRRLALVPVGACPPVRSTCDRVSCRHHLGEDAPHPCVLEVARHGPMSLHLVGAIMGGVSRQRVQQLELRALDKLRMRPSGELEGPDERGMTYAELADLHAPGRYDMILRGSPEHWRR